MGKIMYYATIGAMTLATRLNYSPSGKSYRVLGHEHIPPPGEGCIIGAPDTDAKDPYIVASAFYLFNKDEQWQSRWIHAIAGSDLYDFELAKVLVEHRDWHQKHFKDTPADLFLFKGPVFLEKRLERFFCRHETLTGRFLNQMGAIRVPMWFNADAKNRRLTDKELRYLAQKLPKIAKTYLDRGECILYIVTGPYSEETEDGSIRELNHDKSFVEQARNKDLFPGAADLAIRCHVPLVPTMLNKSPDKRVLEVVIGEAIRDHLDARMNRYDLTELLGKRLDDLRQND